MRKIHLLVIVAFISFTSCVKNDPPTPSIKKQSDTSKGAAPLETLDRSANQSTIAAQVGEPFSIELKGNPTTGYQWALAEQGNTASQLDVTIRYKSDPNPGGATGVGGVYHIQVTPLMAGDSTLELAYRRGPDLAETFSLSVNASE
ncbi:MAG: protease inhibitor I42 family protein [Verrucomicrobiota bacterium]